MAKKITSALRTSLAAEREKIKQEVTTPVTKQPAKPALAKRQAKQPAVKETLNATTPAAQSMQAPSLGAVAEHTPKHSPNSAKPASLPIAAPWANWQQFTATCQSAQHQAINSLLLTWVGINDDLNWFIQQVQRSPDLINLNHCNLELIHSIAMRQRELMLNNGQLFAALKWWTSL
jgi:hypothetical protein